MITRITSKNIKDLYLNFQKGYTVQVENEELDKYDLFKKEYLKKHGNSGRANVRRMFLRKRKKETNNSSFSTCSDELNKIYNSGIGIKLIARELNLSYTTTRNMLKYFNVSLRKGRNVVTEKLKEFRKLKAIFEAKTKTGWQNPEVQKKIKNKHTSRGVQGYYFSTVLNKYIWLRSTYEFIYAKWLDKNKIKWDYEIKTFKLENNINYRPDFFIYENDKLTKIVEIKGFWKNHNYKAIELNEKLKIDVIIISDITKYTALTYYDELSIWKQTRKLKLKDNYEN